MGRKKKLTSERLRQLLEEEIWVLAHMSPEARAVRRESIRRAVERVFKDYKVN